MYKDIMVSNNQAVLIFLLCEISHVNEFSMNLNTAVGGGVGVEWGWSGWVGFFLQKLSLNCYVFINCSACNFMSTGRI